MEQANSFGFKAVQRTVGMPDGKPQPHLRLVGQKKANKGQRGR
jgi:hypothetical protein